MKLLGWCLFWSYMGGLVLWQYQERGLSGGICAVIIVVAFFLFFRRVGFFK